MDQPLVRQVDLVRPEVRNFAHRVFLSFGFDTAGQRSARPQVHLVNNNRSSNNPNNNLPPIPCSVALVQILARLGPPGSVRQVSKLEIS